MIPVGMVPTTRMHREALVRIVDAPAHRGGMKPRMIRTQSRRYRKSSAAAVPSAEERAPGTNAGLVSLKLSPISRGTTTAWPSEETGKSSVTP